MKTEASRTLIVLQLVEQRIKPYLLIQEKVLLKRNRMKPSVIHISQ